MALGYVAFERLIEGEADKDWQEAEDEAKCAISFSFFFSFFFFLLEQLRLAF